MKRSSILWLLPCALFACTGQVELGNRDLTADRGKGDAGDSCASDADCNSGETCGFAISNACTATGACFVTQESACQALEPGCACDGTNLNLTCNGLPDGYALKPVESTGYCPDSGGIGVDAGVSCTTSADCTGTNELCGFKVSLACAATGTCFVNNGSGACQALEPGCSCSGTNLNLTCNGLPEGYALAPVAETGECSDAGGGTACHAAGGTCIPSSSHPFCNEPAASAQDCSGGATCCLDQAADGG
jgi:hypothetical protein